MSKSIPQKAMVLAAGLGSRMRPLTDTMPKPLVPVAGKALIDHVLDRLENAGVSEVIVNTYYLSEQLEDHLSKREIPKIRVSRERDLLDTGGGVNNALKMLGLAPFFVINSDAFWLNGPFDALAQMAMVWEEKKMDGLLLLHSTVEAYGYSGRGDFCCDSDGSLDRRSESEVSPWLFTGIQLLHPRLFNNAPQGAFSLNILYDRAIKKNRLFGTVHDGEWFHVGSPEGLKKSEIYLQQRYAGTRHRSK